MTETIYRSFGGWGEEKHKIIIDRKYWRSEMNNWRETIDKYVVYGDETYSCYVDTDDLYIGEEKSLLSSFSSYETIIEPQDGVGFYFFFHPIEHLDKCPLISRIALWGEGEYFLNLELKDVEGVGSSDEEIFQYAKKTVDDWFAGKIEDNEDGTHIKPSEKLLNFLYALVAYYCGLMVRK